MIRVNVGIQGISPLLQNRFTEENEVAVATGVSSAIKPKSKLTPREQAERKAYIDDNGVAYIPATNIFSCLINAGKFIKAGKNKLTTTKSSLIPAGMWIMDVLCSLNTTEFEVDSRSVVIPATGGRIVAHRPRFDEWHTNSTLEVDDSMFAEDTVREIVDNAGSRVGLGDFRPDRKGPFGRFKVVKWEVEAA